MRRRRSGGGPRERARRGAPRPAAARLAPAWRDRLLDWYRAGARDLPWRRTRDPYRVWLSEVLLQQTRVETVIPYYERFTAAFPDVESLAGAREDRLLKAWEGLGYYQRARNLARAARSIVRERGGEFPRSAAGWRELPGIGPYTSGALASIVNGERVAAVDGNVRRVLARIHLIDGRRDDPALVREVEALAASLVPAESPGTFNQALMELGARICTPRRPRCGICPVGEECRAAASGRAAAIPAPRQVKKSPRRVIAAAYVEQGGRCLLVKRPEDEPLLGGLWELPGIAVTRGDGVPSVLARHLHEAYGLRVGVGRELTRVNHAYSHFSLKLRVFACVLRSTRVEPGPSGARRGAASPATRSPGGHRSATSGAPRQWGVTAPSVEVRWVTRRGLSRFALHAAAKKALAAIGAGGGSRDELDPVLRRG